MRILVFLVVLRQVHVGGLLSSNINFKDVLGIIKTNVRVDNNQTKEIDFTPINHGIAVVSLPAKWNSTITEISNATSKAINFSGTEIGVAITLDTEKQKMVITNYSQTTDIDIVFISCE